MTGIKTPVDFAVRVEENMDVGGGQYGIISIGTVDVFQKEYDFYESDANVRIYVQSDFGNVLKHLLESTHVH